MEAKCVFKCFASLARLTTSKQKLTRNKTKTERNEQRNPKVKVHEVSPSSCYL